MMLFDIIQLFVILATIAVFGYYYYLAGKKPRKDDNK